MDSCCRSSSRSSRSLCIARTLMTLILIGSAWGRVSWGDDAPLPNEVSDVTSAADKIASQLSSQPLSPEIIRQQRALATALQRLLHRGEQRELQSGSESVVRSSESTSSPDPAAVPPPAVDSAETRPESTVPAGDPSVPFRIMLLDRPLADAVWGHLPQHERDELYQSLTEKFLPKYENALKSYYKALAEEPAPGSRGN